MARGSEPLPPKGLIFDIQGFSVHDGPGCRTTVFLSGCPLRCTWCANPEGREKRRRILFSPQRCRSRDSGCVRCAAACPRGAIRLDDGGLRRERTLCAQCPDPVCADACYSEALRVSGKWYGVQELMELLERDRQFWGRDGGVTFSGGDPLFQPEFLLAVLEECRSREIPAAIETCACAETELFLQVLSRTEFAFVDLKQMDSAAHRAQTGVGNEQILTNIAAASNFRWPGRLVLRMPVIRAYNDSIEHARAVCRFMREHHLFEMNLLPFHRMGASKWEQLGLRYPYATAEPPDAETMHQLQQIYLGAGIACYLGSEVLY